MRYLIPILSLLIAADACAGGTVLREIPWTHVPPAAQPRAELVPPDPATPFAHLKITGLENQQTSTNLLDLENPGIHLPNYAIKGQIRYDDVTGRGYLEMWSHFPDGAMYFSRTLDADLLQPIEGSSGWRPFLLPFHSKPGYLPCRITLNLVLPQQGTVDLGPVQLLEYSTPPSAAGQWWTSPQGGWIGGIFGSVAGLSGGLIGWLSSRGKARSAVLGLMKLLAAVGFFLLTFGILALARRQPYHVYYPLLLAGGLLLILMLALFPQIKRRYADLELRRMKAIDSAG